MNIAYPVPPRLKSAEVKGKRRSANISLDPAMVEEARALGINISRACEAGLEARIKEVRRERWLAENKEALEASNAYVEKYGLPLADLRLF